MADLAGTFRRPFTEQVAAFRIRLGNQLPTQAWDDLRRDAHDAAFVVAGAQQADLLADLGEAVRKAVEDGTTFETFRQDLRATVERRGWHGWTGEGSLRGEEWRMRTIYQTNLRTSYMAGRHAQLRRGKFRYWVYRHSGAEHPRLDHLSWDGLTLSPDDPFWKTHYPPNGWGCGCKVRGANSDRSVARLGGDLSKEKPKNWNARDARTGAPPGIGKYWDYAPGRSVSDALAAIARKLDAYPGPIAPALLEALAEGREFETWYANPVGAWPLARISADAAQRISAPTRIVSLPAGVLQKQRREHPDILLADYASLQQAIDGANHVIRETPEKLIFIYEPPNALGRVFVIEASTNRGGLALISLRKLSSKSSKRAGQIRSLLKRDT
jgi:hypothetical protein